MSKAILVMDMPKSCIKCPMLDCYDECVFQDEDANFLANDSFDELRKGCPLREMPEKKEEKYPLKAKTTTGKWIDLGMNTDKVAVGFNQCIDEILKGGSV